MAVSLMSPIDVLSGQLFFMHMTQHLLLTMVAVPLLLLGNPFPVLVWGLPTTGAAAGQRAAQRGLALAQRAGQGHLARASSGCSTSSP